MADEREELRLEEPDPLEFGASGVELGCWPGNEVPD